jgi:DNA invertase Pin-like site-specific DNA recombinase
VIEQNRFTSPSFDLFGQATRPGAGLPGRPQHMPTDRHRAQVRQLRAAGFCQAEIAAAIGITAPTLLRHYHHELGSKSQAWRKMKHHAAD